MNAETSATHEYADLYHQHYQQVYRYLYYRLNYDADTAKDLTQQTFTRAWKQFPTYQDRGFSYGAYLLRTVHNVLVNYYRDINRMNERVCSYDRDEFVERMDFGQEDTHSTDVCLALLKITIPKRYMLVLYYFEGYTVPEISALFGKRDNTVRLAIRKARSDFKKYFMGEM